MGGHNKNKPAAFTLVELLVALIIIGIFFSLAIPSYQSSIEKSKAKNAEYTLISIYNSQKRYKLDHNHYYACAAAVCTADELENQSNLGVYISDSYFNYSITNTSSSFNATATRRGEGICGGMNMSVIEKGSQVNKECEVW
ncbi:MAG: prepilin-type N-terminal cleavage/methylation domain-containing protein [Candidatus Omnitrophica bacterium]|nr:prepilin-type N-terminal cleavage/methylation domain-containing protein [Candidatus Omnitrophota bacterium]MBU2044690.1 prepilin-type N-terminal cleavage/methylation domain-containing protein [Candidatus Omnitrophota bacterium]MBU2265420.1 prepilin-type N-terminal cleavage/methylation domain-containing protein [Candidatus Omnitrophota bacterium]MBU2474252.1 prepilin-type N-terminal cleavage/methylation domain-containing protein [Candidatus Omnitrophota bacterium]